MQHKSHLHEYLLVLLDDLMATCPPKDVHFFAKWVHGVTTIITVDERKHSPKMLFVLLIKPTISAENSVFSLRNNIFKSTILQLNFDMHITLGVGAEIPMVPA